MSYSNLDYEAEQVCRAVEFGQDPDTVRNTATRLVNELAGSQSFPRAIGTSCGLIAIYLVALLIRNMIRERRL